MPLHTIETYDKTNRSLESAKRKGTQRVVIKNISPPLTPLFPKVVELEKYARHDGMPKPNENPNEKEAVRRLKTECSKGRIGKSETKIPKIIHRRRKQNSFTLRESKTPIKLEAITAEECTPRIVILIGFVKPRLSRTP